ncbi:hypothetical protein DFO80_1465 [Rhodobacter sp. 140A]|nr:hypothetical protein DFO80_1465 [Rhodobacter sp. 140A]
MKSDPMIWLRRVRDLLQDHGRHNTDRTGKNHQFNNINPALTTLDPGNQRLMALKALGHSSLRQACRFPGVDQCFA